MRKIEEVCANLLDNADLKINLSFYPDITLNFSVAGKVDSRYWEVVFNLVSVTTLNITREHEEQYTPNDSYLVLSASVAEKNLNGIRSFSVQVGHGSDFNFFAECENFTYQLESYSEAEFKQKK